jgi:hypothetical protein
MLAPELKSNGIQSRFTVDSTANKTEMLAVLSETVEIIDRTARDSWFLTSCERGTMGLTEFTRFGWPSPQTSGTRTSLGAQVAFETARFSLSAFTGDKLFHFAFSRVS